MLPARATYVRHANSEENFATDHLRRTGTPLAGTEDLDKVGTMFRRLSRLGLVQTEHARRWFRSQPTFTRCFVSPFVRACETAGLLRLNLRWKLDERLGERPWGRHIDELPFEDRLEWFERELARRVDDPFLWKPPGGSTMVAHVLQVHSFVDSLRRSCEQDDNVLIVCHGETMAAARVIHEHLTPADLKEVLRDRNSRTKLSNLRAVQYERDEENPNRFGRVRFIDPLHPDDPEKNLPWQPIEVPLFSDDDLLEGVERYPRHLLAA